MGKRRIPKMIDGTQLCKESKRVGYCWCSLHPGYINKRLIGEHNCLNKKCPFFEMLDRNSTYWDKKKEREEGKNKKKLEGETLENVRRIAIEETYDFDCAVTTIIKEKDSVKIIIASNDQISKEVQSDILSCIKNEIEEKYSIKIIPSFKFIQNNKNVISEIIKKIRSDSVYYKEIYLKVGDGSEKPE